MEILILIGAMILVGILVGWAAGLIWKDNRPMGVRGDYITAIIAAILTGLLDWFLIPAMGIESVTLKYAGTILEPPMVALFVLWVVRKAKR